jgi:putative colanic acid biosynthesis glycosyltransferase
MKVLLIDVNCKHSSTGKVAYDLFNELRDKGHDASVAYGRGPKIQEPFIFKYGLDIETLFHAALTRLTGLTGYFSPFSTFRLIQYIKKFKPEVVHLQDLHGYHLNIGRLINFLKTNKIKTVWTFQSEFMYTGKCGHSKECEKFQTECHDCPLLGEYPKSLFFDLTKIMFNEKKRWFDDWKNLKIVLPSKWMQSRLKLSFLKNANQSVIQNGLDISIFNTNHRRDLFDEYRGEFKTVVLSVIANLTDFDKGYDVILSLSNLTIFKDYLFVVVTKATKVIDLNGNLLFYPYIKDQNKLAEVYSSCDTFLTTSRFETYSMTSLEAISCGIPVVGFAVGGIPDAVQGNDDYLTKVDFNELSDKLNLLSSNEVKTPKIDLSNVSRARMFREYLITYEK